MAEEEQATQNESSDQSQEETLDSFLGDDASGDKQDETSDLSPEDKEAKKERDFEQGMHKFQDLYKAERAKVQELTSKVPAEPTTPTVGQTDQPLDATSIEDDPGVKILRDLIDQSVQKAISPVVEGTRAEQETKVWGEFQSKEHVNALLPQIQQTYAGMSKSGNLANDLENARLITIGKYHTQITQAASEAGREQGFKDRTFKTSQAGITGRPAQGTKTDDFAKRYRSGQATTEEIKERADDITLIEREDLDKVLGR